MARFKRRNVEEYTDSLAAYLPNDELFAAKSIRDSNFRNFLKGLATELYRANGYLMELDANTIPSGTERLLDEWERALGIPDECFAGNGTIDERRRDVVVKLASLGVQTQEDFVALAALFGVPVSVSSGRASITFPLTFPTLMFSTELESRFTLVVDFTVVSASVFPLIFPFTFGSEDIARLECLFRKLRPANCELIFQNLGA